MLPIISNPTPPVVGIFDRYWMTNMTVMRGKTVMLELAPYDGTSIIGGQNRRLRFLLADEPKLAQLIAGLTALVTAKAGKAEPKAIIVQAPCPDREVVLTAIFDTPFVVRDLLGEAEKDLTVAQIVGGLLMWVGDKQR